MRTSGDSSETLSARPSKGEPMTVPAFISSRAANGEVAVLTTGFYCGLDTLESVSVDRRGT